MTEANGKVREGEWERGKEEGKAKKHAPTPLFTMVQIGTEEEDVERAMEQKGDAGGS